jgi:tetratricopeptide (TPR) repeat protein
MSQDDALEQAEAALKRGDAAGAEQAIAKQWRDLSKAPADALHIMAMARMTQNNFAEGERFMRSAVQSEPNSLRHNIALGHILSAAGKHAEAVDAYWAGLSVALAFANYHAGRPAEAERAALEALRTPTADGFDALSCALRAQGKAQEALEAADEALRIDWQHLNAQNSRGAALLMLKRPKEALDAFDAIAAQGVEMPVLALNRGEALEQLGRSAEARALYDDAARRWPNLPNLQERLKAKRH